MSSGSSCVLEENFEAKRIEFDEVVHKRMQISFFAYKLVDKTEDILERKAENSFFLICGSSSAS